MAAQPTDIEREAELGRLEAALAGALGGRGRTVLIEGPAGIGKSALLGGFGRRSARRPLELVARGGEVERRVPYGVVRQLLVPTAVERWPGSGPAATVAAMLGLGEEGGELAPDREGAVVHALYCLFGELADDGGLLLRVDDLHHADAASLRALAYLAARLDGHPLLLAAATRPPEGDAPQGLRELRGAAETELVAPGPLSVAGCSRLVAARVGAEPSNRFCVACREATGGNPQLLHELLREAGERGVDPDDAGAERIASLVPDGVVRSVVLRLERLSEPVRALARTVAVLERASLGQAAALAALDDAGAAEAASQLAAAGVLAPGLPLEYAHPILREAAYAALPAPVRDVGHREAARLLAGEPPEAERAVAHLLACEPRGEAWAVELLRGAGAEALRRGAPVAAARALERALAEDPGGDAALRGMLGLARIASGDTGGVEDLERAIGETADADARAALVAPLAEAEMLGGRLDSGVGRLRAVLDDPGTGPAAADAVRSSYLTMGRQLARFAADVSQRLAAATDEPDPGLAAQLAADALYSGRSAADAIRFARIAVRGAGDEAPGIAITELTLGAHALAGADAFAEAEAALGRSMLAAERLGSAMLYGLTLHTRLFCRQRSGDLRGALADAAAVLELSEGAGLRYVALQERALQAEALLDRGSREEAEATLRPCFEAAGSAAFPGTLTALVVLLARSRLGLERADAAAALEDARRAGEVAVGLGADTAAMGPWRGLAARALARLGEHEEGRRHADRELETAQTFGAPRAIGVALAARGAAEPEPARALPWLERAVEALEGSAAPLEWARAQLELGTLLRRARRRADSRPPLRHALELAHRCGATGLASRARDELEASGARLGRERLSGVESLTPRERQLAELAAEGLSNPQIAARAFVSRKTVETHLSAVYRKLGIGSREQLATALGGASLMR